MIPWENIISLLVVLFSFEGLKALSHYVFADTFHRLKKNREVKDSAEHINLWINWMRLRDFKQPLKPLVINRLYLDALKVRDVDKELADTVINILQLPIHLALNKPKYTYDYEAFLNQKISLHELAEKLSKKCEYLSYKPVYDWNGIPGKILAYIRRIQRAIILRSIKIKLQSGGKKGLIAFS